MKKIIAFTLFVSISGVLSGQEICDAELIMSKKGKWTKTANTNMLSGNQSQVIARVEKFQKLLQAAYPEPIGIEAKWYASMGGYYPSLSKNSVAYDLNARFFTWYCNTNLKKLMLGTETGNTFYIWTNRFKWFGEEDKAFSIENKPTYLLTPRRGELKGFPLFSGNDNRSSNTGTSYSRTMLITRKGELPYIPISRKQYLLAFIKYQDSLYNTMRVGLMKMPVRSDSEEETYKNQQLERVVNAEKTEQTKEKARSNFLRGYTTEKQRRIADLERINSAYERTIKNASTYLKNSSADDLAKPAYMKNTGYASGFIEFGTEEDGRMLAHVNPAYFNSKLPAYAPQFLVVYWQWNREKPSLDYAKHIEENFDFKALQDLLDR